MARFLWEGGRGGDNGFEDFGCKIWIVNCVCVK